MLSQIKWLFSGFVRRFFISLIGTLMSFATLTLIVGFFFDGSVTGSTTTIVLIASAIIGPAISAICTKYEDVFAEK